MEMFTLYVGIIKYLPMIDLNSIQRLWCSDGFMIKKLKLFAGYSKWSNTIEMPKQRRENKLKCEIIL